MPTALTASSAAARARRISQSALVGNFINQARIGRAAGRPKGVLTPNQPIIPARANPGLDPSQPISLVCPLVFASNAIGLKNASPVRARPRV